MRERRPRTGNANSGSLPSWASPRRGHRARPPRHPGLRDPLTTTRAPPTPAPSSTSSASPSSTAMRCWSRTCATSKAAPPSDAHASTSCFEKTLDATSTTERKHCPRCQHRHPRPLPLRHERPHPVRRRPQSLCRCTCFVRPDGLAVCAAAHRPCTTLIAAQGVVRDHAAADSRASPSSTTPSPSGSTAPSSACSPVPVLSTPS